jgi:hypothetical protein
MNSTAFYEETHEDDECNAHQENSPPILLKKVEITAVNRMQVTTNSDNILVTVHDVRLPLLKPGRLVSC